MIIKRITTAFIILMALAFMKTGVESLISPRAVLSQVGIVLDNPSAVSSMRAVYGGMHLIFGVFCIWGIFRDQAAPLILIILYTTGFTIGRLSGIFLDGRPNQFVTTWMITEICCGLLATLFMVLRNRKEADLSGRSAIIPNS